MNPITLGTPNLFVKGIANVIIRDTLTGNIIGYDNVASDGAITSSVNLQEITGGFNNPLVTIIPDTTRLTGTLTSQAFSLRQRAMISGGAISNNAVGCVCKEFTPTSNNIAVADAVKSQGQDAADTSAWCNVRTKGSTELSGTTYYIKLTDDHKIYTDKACTTLATFTGVQEVFYFKQITTGEMLNLPTNFNPSVASLEIKYGVYAKQNNSVTSSTLAGYLYVFVPQVIFNGDAGISASQTTNSTTDYNWMALTPDTATIACASCGGNSSNYAYYVYIPCSTATDGNVIGVAVVGGALSVAAGGTKQIPVVLLLNNGQFVTPKYSTLAYSSDTAAKATVSNDGVVTGVASGAAVVTCSYTTTGGTTYTDTCNVTVTA